MKIHNQPEKQGAAKRRIIAALCAVVLLVACAPMIDGTLAFLMEKTPELVNTFELGVLNYVLNFEENKPEKAEDSARIDGMPLSKKGSIDAPEYTFEVTEEPTLEGYKFLGWAKNSKWTEENPVGEFYPYTEGTSSVPVYYDEDDGYEVSTATTTKTVYAIWKQMDFMVHFDTQTKGEVANPASQKVTYKERYGTLPQPTRTGYTFMGWTLTSGELADDFVTASSTVEIAKDHTLYAQWGAKSYVIRYHANTGEGTMEDQIIEYDKPTALSPNAFTKDDYSFGGWSLTEDGEKKYNDKQIVVNLLEEGYLDLYAVWIQDSHTVYFDYNGGTGSPDSMQVQNGKAYGTLPEYPIHPTKEISETEIMSYLFTGWYTEPNGGTRVYPTSVVNRTDDHTLYAHWKEAPTNNVIKDLVVKNNPDDNKDGVVDSFYVNLKCSSYFEKLNIPLENLVVGQKYKLSFNESNNATYGMTESGYGGAIYGFIITPNKTLTAGSIKQESIEDGGLIKQFSDRNDGQLNGPRSWETTFTAEAGTMYWTWDYGLIQDGYPRDYNYTNIKLVPVVPEIKFGNKTLILHENSKAQVLNDISTEYSTNFEFDGDGHAETMYYPITGLTTGTTYTITFNHNISGALIDSTLYNYGCGISSTAPTKFGSYMNNLGASWISTTQPVITQLNTTETESITLTFTATSDTAYWVWNMANCSDAKNCTIDVDVTHFSAKHKDGGQITYNISKDATLTSMLTMVPVDMDLFQLTHNVSADELNPFTQSFPCVGEDYVMTFTPAEGYAMPEYVRVLIDGIEYLYISEDLPKGIDVDGLECYVLTISKDLLMTAQTVHIEAIAVQCGVSYVIDLPDVTVTGTENTEAGVNGVLTLTGESIPDVLTVDVNGEQYVTGTNAALLKACSKTENVIARGEWLTVNEDGSQIITIPADLMIDGTVITVTGTDYSSYNLNDLTYENLN